MTILKKISENILYVFLMLTFVLFIFRSFFEIKFLTDVNILLLSLDICILIDLIADFISKEGNKFLRAMALGVALSLNSTMLGILDMRIFGCVMAVGMIVAFLGEKRNKKK